MKRDALRVDYKDTTSTSVVKRNQECGGLEKERAFLLKTWRGRVASKLFTTLVLSSLPHSCSAKLHKYHPNSPFVYQKKILFKNGRYQRIQKSNRQEGTIRRW